MIQDGLVYGISLIFLLGFFYWIFLIFRSDRWIRHASKLGRFNSNRAVYVLIPALNEVGRLENTVEYFQSVFRYAKRMKICIITTKQEQEYSKDDNTITLAKKLEKRYSKVVHYHYSGEGRKMAHQLNFAIRKLIGVGCPKDAVFAVYNADSRPHKDTFAWVMGCMDNDKTAKVFQQYGDYSLNLWPAYSGIGRGILSSAAAWQNRWSLGFEMGHALDQFQEFRNNGFLSRIFYPLNYCIGHGLFFTRDIYSELGGFNEDTHNEDAIFGLELSYLGEKIVPIPYFDAAESPDTLKGLYIQKSNWFFGPLESYRYMSKIIKKRKQDVDRLRLFALSSKLFTHALNWALGPALAIALLFLLVFNFSIENTILGLGALMLYLPVVNYISLVRVSMRRYRQGEKGGLMVGIALGSIPFYIMHGLSAYRALALWLVSKLTGKEPKKGKTPMRLSR